MKYSLKVVKIFITLLFFVMYSAVYIITTKDKESRIELLLSQQISNLEHNYKIILNRYDTISDIIDNELFNNSSILELFYKAKHARNENDRNMYRTMLYYEIKPNFENLKSVGADIIQFIFEDNTSFLRMHAPQMYGDDLSKIRLSLNYVNSKAKHISGFENGKKYHAYRNVFPLFYKNEYLGAVEISFSSHNIRKTMLKLHNTDTHFILNKNIFDSIAFQKDAPVIYINSLEHKDFLSAYEDNRTKAYKIKINLALKDEIDKKIKEEKAFALYHHDEKQTHIISFFPVRSIDKKNIEAYLVSYTKSQYLEEMLHEYLWVNGVAFFGFLLLSIAVYNNLIHRTKLEIKVKQRTKELEDEKAVALKATRTKSQFLANMSHEIRTPINGVIGISHLLSQTDLDQKQKDYLAKIDNSAKSLLGIINDILDFSKIEAGKLTIEKVEFDLMQTIDEVVSTLKINADDKGLKININYADDIGRVFIGDSFRLSQILTNLLGNAIKFTNNGDIDISVSRINKSMLRFEVKDSGIGLSEKEKKRLFASFSQADSSTTRKYGGTGLGLAISKQLVELMDGRIWVESEKGIGSSFIFEIKLKESDSNNVKDDIQDIVKEEIDFKADKILIVEDNTTNQLVLLGLLEDYVKEMDIANNGQEAVDMFEKGKYELILMDLQMPVMDGYAAAKIIRTKDKEIPIIALSANAMKEDTQKSKAVGMNEHLTKPINVEMLFEILNRYVNKDRK